MRIARNRSKTFSGPPVSRESYTAYAAARRVPVQHTSVNTPGVDRSTSTCPIRVGQVLLTRFHLSDLRVTRPSGLFPSAPSLEIRWGGANRLLAPADSGHSTKSRCQLRIPVLLNPSSRRPLQPEPGIFFWTLHRRTC